MLLKPLAVTHTVTANGEPLVCVDNLPGPAAELTPTNLRDLSYALYRIANDTEVFASARRTLNVVPSAYPMSSPPVSIGDKANHLSPCVADEVSREFSSNRNTTDVWTGK